MGRKRKHWASKGQCSLEGIGKVSHQGCLARADKWGKSFHCKGRDNTSKWTVAKFRAGKD